jgi:hypothetical protein
LKRPSFISAREQAEEQSPAHTIYANVLLQALDDVGRGETLHRAEQMAALNWFKEELSEVSLVCAACQVKPQWVYREVQRRLKKIGSKSKRITFIRWCLRKKALKEIE